MALDFDYLTAITRKKYIPKVEDNVYESSSLLSLLRAKERVSVFGRKLQVPVRYGKNGARGAYSKFDLFDTTPQDNVAAAVFNFGNYYVNVSISGEDERDNAGDMAVIKLLEDEMADASMSMEDQVGTDLYTGTGTKRIVGLDTAIGTADYGGIDSDTETWWQSTVDTTAHTGANMVDSTNASYIHKLLRTGYKECDHLNKAPDLIVTSQDTFDLYEETLQTNARYVKGQEGRFLADAGFQALEFRNIAITKDDFVDDTADAMYMINTEFLELYVHPDNNFRFTGFQKPTNQDAKVGQVLLSAQLTISNRRMFYRWSDLNN